MRTVIWALVWWSRATAALSTREPRAPKIAAPSAATTPRNKRSRISVVSKLAPEDEKNSDRRMTVAKSASEAPAMTSCPNGVPVWRASLRTATTIPNDVAARMIASSSGASTSSIASKISATTSASPIDTQKAAATSPRCRSRASKAISSPARKNRNTKPICAKTWSGAVMSTMSSAIGPITMPATSSLTIGGTLGIGRRSTTNGATVAAATAMARSV
jgi:hypothetical protein